MTQLNAGAGLAAPPPELLLSAIVDSSEDAIVSKNLDGIITSWNEAARRMFGYTAEEAVGRSVLMLVPPDRKDEEPKILAKLRRGERVGHFETIRVRKNGEQFPVALTISPVKDATGVVIGASKIARDISEFRRIAAEREELLESERIARMQAEHASRMKDDFLSTVSHELRTPLNAIVGWTEVLKESEGQTEDVLHGLEIIQKNAHAQAQLIDDLLDLGRISSGKMTLCLEYVDVLAVVQDAIASVSRAAESKHIEIRSAHDRSLLGLLGDRQRLQQVIWNLLSNAIKFTAPGGVVIVSTRRAGGNLEVAVSDNGEGIDPAFLPHVFERFRQADASTTRRAGGLGIGLSLVKQFVELHGGLVQAESPGPGRGSTFTVSLPAPPIRPEAMQSLPEAPPRTVVAPPEQDLAGVKVLAVDDDADSLEVVKRVLNNRHAHVQTASSMEEALNLFQAFSPDIVLSDIGMPVHDGYELVQRLRSLPGGGTVPAAAFTALARAEDRTRALQAGFQAHVAKPIAPAELVAVVRSLTALRPHKSRTATV